MEREPSDEEAEAMCRRLEELISQYRNTRADPMTNKGRPSRDWPNELKPIVSSMQNTVRNLYGVTYRGEKT